jgi:hypothetical protein
MLAIDMLSDEPPALINGIGTPVGGIDDVTTATFMITCNATIDIIPVASRRPKLSFAVIATRKPRHIKNIKIKSIATPPIKPNSSHIMANMKSFWGMGK